MARRIRKQKQHAKRVNYKLIGPATDAGRAMYPMVNRLIEQHHSELTNARIALAWSLAWKPDVDGIVKLGKCKKASDLDRELAAYDFVIVLRQEFYQDATVTDDQRKALLDHEITHATVRLDKDGEPMRDERGRVVYRTRKHDVEEFSEIVARHGIWKRDLERMASAMRRPKQLNLLDTPAVAGDAARVASDPKVQDALRRLAPKPGSGIDTVTISAGGKAVTLTQADRQRMDSKAQH